MRARRVVAGDRAAHAVGADPALPAGLLDHVQRAARSSPRRCASASASAAPARLMPASRLLTSLVRAPSPGAADAEHLGAQRLDQRALALEDASSQATIRLMVPSRARAGPPDIGASMAAMPRSARRCANRFDVLRARSSGTAAPPGPARSARPRRHRPNSTSSVCAASTTHDDEAAHAGTACAASDARAARPARSRAATFAASMSHTATGQPQLQQALPPWRRPCCRRRRCRRVQAALRSAPAAGLGDRHQDAQPQAQRDHRRAAVADEGQRHADHRQDAADHAHVDEGIGEEDHGDRAGQQAREHGRRLQRRSSGRAAPGT